VSTVRKVINQGVSLAPPQLSALKQEHEQRRGSNSGHGKCCLSQVGNTCHAHPVQPACLFASSGVMSAHSTDLETNPSLPPHHRKLTLLPEIALPVARPPSKTLILPELRTRATFLPPIWLTTFIIC